MATDEVQQVLTCALLCLDDDGLGRLTKRLSPETVEVLRRTLSHRSSPEATTPARPGRAKVLQSWNEALREWRKAFEGFEGRENDSPRP